MMTPRKLIHGAVGIVLVTLASSISYGANLNLGDAAPLFTLKALNPEVSKQPYVHLSDYIHDGTAPRGKATFLSFFANSCEPCKRELPYLVELQKLYSAQGFQVLMVTIDKDAQEVALARALAKEQGVTFPVLNDRFGIVARRYGVDALPMSFMIDHAGILKMTNTGFADDSAQKLLAQTRMALGLPLGDPSPEVLWPYVGVPAQVQKARAQAAAEKNAMKKAAKKKKYRKKRKHKRKNRNLQTH